MTSVRPAAVAGAFYPGNPKELDATVQYHLSQVEPSDAPAPKAIIAPHAGYIYSGPVAAAAYARIRPARDVIKRVVLLGPCHRVAVRGLALSGADAFATPLGEVAVDKNAVAAIKALPQVEVFDATHQEEHSLEVHLPFLQVILGAFSLVPLVVGEADAEKVAEVIERLWGGPETLIVISTDLSHFQDYEAARRRDRATCRAIEAMDGASIGREDACGRIPMRGLLALAKRRAMTVTTVDLRNSGDTAGPRDRVVGYGAWVFDEAATKKIEADAFAQGTRALLKAHGATLMGIAAASIEHGLAHDGPLRLDPDAYAPELRRNGACFITLKRGGKLRGCIGSTLAHQALAVDAAENGYAAAFRDHRFKGLKKAEVEGLELSISVLSQPWAMTVADEADLVTHLRPGIDGLIIRDKGKRAVFLPTVWEGLPQPRTFLHRLKLKAGFAADHWSETFQAWRFVAEEMSAAELDDPAALWSAAKQKRARP
jgi:hypothetical protein